MSKRNVPEKNGGPVEPYRDVSGQMVVDRQVYSETELSSQYTAKKTPKPTIPQRAGNIFRDTCACSAKCWRDAVYQYLPFIRIMKKYNIKRDLVGDIVAGITVGIVQIPQGMAYGLLASVEPVFGLYSSFFPVLIYFFFGTSRHIAMGTFAITSMMVGSVVDRYDCGGSSSGGDAGNAATTVAMATDLTTSFFNATGAPGGGGGGGGGDGSFSEKALCQIGIASSVMFFGGLLELLLGILRLGWITVYLSDPLTRGYMTASAVYVMTSQVKYLFGLKLTRYSGPLNLFYTYIELIPKLNETNIAALVISIICILVLAVFKEHLQPRFKKKFKVPFPIELIIVVAATVASYCGKFSERWGVDIVHNIPKGFPKPAVPDFTYTGELLPASISIAIVGYANSMSLAKLFAKKHGYQVDATQELLAHGISNTASSFFNCIFAAPSMSRTLVFEGAGAITQIAGLVSCILILLVILVIGPLFSDLPKAVLGCIIVVSLKGMFMQFEDLPHLWRVDKIDLSIWVVTFIGTILCDVDLGLGVGVGWALLTVVYRTQRAHSALLGRIGSTDIYRNIKKFQQVEEIPGIKLFRFEAALHYANKDRFLDELVRRTGLDASAIKILKKKMEKKRAKEVETPQSTPYGTPYGSRTTLDQLDPKEVQLKIYEATHTLIIDCSVMGYVDYMGASCLQQTVKEFGDVGITVYLTGCRAPIRRTLVKAGFHDKMEEDVIYVSVHDAVTAAIESSPPMGLSRANSQSVDTMTSHI